MRFEVWEPYYRDILEYFGFDRAQDEEAARLLATLMTRDNILSLTSLTCGNDITVCGNAPCLKKELDKISGVIFAADAAAEVLDSHGIVPDAVFTDLDGADERGAAHITIIGFDLDDANVDPMKRGKLFWARKLLAAIGHVC